jgi:hypothetical protein
MMPIGPPPDRPRLLHNLSLSYVCRADRGTVLDFPSDRSVSSVWEIDALGRRMGGKDMTEEAIKARLAEIEAEIEVLPGTQQAHLMELLAETKLRHHQIRQAADAALDALQDWRIAMKYLIFDREAAMREARQSRPGR